MYKYLLALICVVSTCAAVETSSSDWDNSYEYSESDDISLQSPICSVKDCYTIYELLGAGAFGTVYKIEDTKHKPLALKTYQYNKNHDNSWWGLLDDAEREFQRGQMLNHPNIVKSFDFFTHYDGNAEMANIVLEFVKGKQIGQSEDTIPYMKIKIAARQFIDAVRHAVSHDLMHLDLHGGNVMLTDNNTLKIIDLASFFSVDEVISFHSSKTRDIGPMLNREMKIHEFFERRPQVKALMEDENGLKRDFQSDEFVKNQILFDYFSDVANFYVTIIFKADLPWKKSQIFENQVNKIRNRYEAKIINHEKVSIDAYLLELRALIK